MASQSTNQSINQSVNQSINQSISQSINQSVNQSLFVLIHSCLKKVTKFNEIVNSKVGVLAGGVKFMYV